jgi:hypothetical protein
VCSKYKYRVFGLKNVYNIQYRECDGKVKDKKLKVLADYKLIDLYFVQNQSDMFMGTSTMLCITSRRWRKLSVRIMSRIRI